MPVQLAALDSPQGDAAVPEPRWVHDRLGGAPVGAHTEAEAEGLPLLRKKRGERERGDG